MTVASTTTKVSYSGNGSTTVFTVPFYFLAAGDLQVILRSSAGVETVQTLTSQYTVTGAGVASGGTVTMLTAPVSGTTLTILRNVSPTQETDLLPNDRLPAESLETALDKLTMLVQQLDEENDRSIKFARSDTSTSSTLPTSGSRAGKILSFDGSGNPVTSFGISGYTLIGEEIQTATSGQTVFNLTTASYTPGAKNLLVFIDGVNQNVGDSYTETSANIVTFSQGLHVGAKVKFTSFKV